MASLGTPEGEEIPDGTPAFQRLRDYILEGREAQIGELRVSVSEGRRYLPREGLVRTVLAEVPASSEDYPAEPRNVWRLKPSLEESVDFALEGELQPQPDVVFTGFGSRSQVRMLPYGPPLSAIASDHFAFLTSQRRKGRRRRRAASFKQNPRTRPGQARAKGVQKQLRGGAQILWTSRRTRRSQLVEMEREKRNDLEDLLDRTDGVGDALGPEVHSEGMGGASVSFTAIRRPYQECWDSSYVDQLNNDQPQAAKATALLAIASLDQAAIDQGNWPLASEFAMQPSPPFSAFQRPRALDPLEARQTKLTDPRWISVFMARLKERDAFHTAKRNLSGPGSGGSGVSDVPPGSRRESLRREAQLGALRSLRRGVEDWNISGPFGPEQLGRSAPKFESLYDMLRACQQEYDGLAPGTSLDEAVFSFSTPSHVLPVEPDRLNFVDRPSFDPRPYLDKAKRRTYEDPISYAQPVSDETRLPHVAVRAIRDQARRLLELLDSSGRLALYPKG
eukprot:s374_g9.t2